MLFGLLFASACATASPRPVANIPAIRHQIDDAIAADPGNARRTADFHYDGSTDATQLPGSRRITAMGKVAPDRAVVYTRPGDTTLEETWVRDADGWKLARVTELGNPSSTSASR